MTKARGEHSTDSLPAPTRRAFLEASGLALLGLAVPPLVGSAAAQTPKRGGTLVVAADVSPPGLDPQKSAAAHSWMISEHVYSNLLRRDAKMNIVGDLAESWTVSQDKRTYTFKIRHGVKFHDGSILTSRDVKASYDKIVFPSPGIVSSRHEQYRAVEAIEAPSADTVVFRLKYPEGSFIASVASAMP